MTADDFRPGLPLPALDRVLSGQLYHVQLPDGSWGTVSRDEGTWRWRTLRGSTYGEGSRSELERWLRGTPTG